MGNASKPFLQKFNAKFTVNPNTGCWDWHAAKFRGGYGNMRLDGKSIGAHRVSYAYFKGDCTNKVVRHKCDNPCCVNPDHLELGNTQDNVNDRVTRNRSAVAEKHGKAVLDSELVVAIFNATGTHRTIAQQFNTDHRTVGRIKRREIWQSITLKI